MELVISALVLPALVVFPAGMAGAALLLLVFLPNMAQALRAYEDKIYILGMVTMITTWCILLGFIAGVTEGRLAPWDQWSGFAPPEGTWERQISDFFGRWPNTFLPAVMVIAISLGLFLFGTYRTTNAELRFRLPIGFAATHLLFLTVAFPLLTLADRLPDLWLPPPRSSVDIGYHRTWLSILVTCFLSGLLLWGQSRIVTFIKGGKDQSR